MPELIDLIEADLLEQGIKIELELFKWTTTY